MSGAGERPVLVLHDLGDADGAAPWRSALAVASWPGEVLAPDLPGHASASAPVGGAYDLTDPAVVAVGLLAGRDGEPPLVVGVGRSGWSAWLLALGGRAAGLVLVDGLGGPWADARATIADWTQRLRAIADDPAAMAPAPPSGLDPRLRHGVGTQPSRDLAVRAAAATTVPTLVVETSRSPLAPPDAAELAGGFAAGAELVELADRSPAAVVAAVGAWAGGAAAG